MNSRCRSAGPGRALRVLTLGVLVIFLGAFCTIAAVPHYSIRGWQTEDGLPENSVNTLAQTRGGYLWLGTYAGLVRFDGVRFTVFDSETTPELKTSRITSLYEDPTGTLWIGHETGELTRLQAGVFQSVEVPAQWTGGKTIMIRADEAGAIWLLNKEGLLARVKDGRIIAPREGPRAGGGVFTMARDRRGKLWVARHGALGVLEAGQFIPCAFEETPGYVQAVCASRDGGVWIVKNGRVRRWRDGKWNADLGTGPWGLYAVTALLETRRGDVAVGTSDQGLYLLSADAPPQHFDRAHGLASDWVRSLCEDREGNLWLGVGNNGLNALRTVSFEAINPPDHWNGCAALAVTLGRDGSLWVGTEGAGLYRLENGQWQSFGGADGLTSKFVWTEAEDAQGRLWVGTWGGGLFVREGERFVSAPGLAGVAEPITALLPGQNGELWIGSGAGLIRYANGQPAWVNGRDAPAARDVRSITEDAQGTVWFGMSGGGLGCLKEGQLRTFRKSDGLPSDFVLCLRTEADGTLWIGTFGGGLARFRQGRFAKISAREGLANNVICHIEEDGAGDFWMSSSRGIMRVSRRALEQCADGQVSRVACAVYGIGDGLETTECSGGFQPAGCKTADGRIWFPTRKGLVAVAPNNIKTNSLPPPVVIEEILVDGQPQQSRIQNPKSKLQGPEFTVSGPQLEVQATAQEQTSEPAPEAPSAFLQVPPGRQRFEFQYTGLSFTAPEKVRFKYRLKGLENDWVDAGLKRSAVYSYLPAGNYVFTVTACNNDGVWNEEGAQVAFTVLPFFWQTWWFRGLAYLAGIGGAGGAVLFQTRRRHQRKLERLEHQRALERERTRIAQDIHDDIGASLTRITMLSQSARKAIQKPELAGAHLEVIYNTGRAITRALDEIVWAVNPKHDTLDSVATYLVRFAQDFLGPSGIRCRLDLPVELPSWPLRAEVRHNLFLAFKEALHNILKHSAASEVVVSLTLAPASFRLCVEDNGRGFLPGEFNTISSPETARPSGNGLENMRRRLEDIGGQCHLRSAPGKGTKVSFEISNAPQAAGRR